MSEPGIVPGDLIRTLFARDRVLATSAAIVFAGFLVAAAIAPFDTRAITGINPWIKPMKFLISIAIFLATIAWFMSEVRPGARGRTSVRVIFVTTMAIELVCIIGQAARGTTSHFNQATAFDAAVFSLMGAAITINTLAAAWLIAMLRRDIPPERAGYLWGVRLGLAVFVIGSFMGFFIVTNHGHTVPGPDGGAGLPFVNWSIDRGDLRVGHFVGLHALQALPILGFLLDRSRRLSPSTRRLAVGSVATVWLAAMGLLLVLALSGRPLVRL